MPEKEVDITYTRTRDFVKELSEKYGLPTDAYSISMLRKGITRHCKNYDLLKELSFSTASVNSKIHGTKHLDAIRNGEKKELNLWEATEPEETIKNKEHIFTESQKYLLYHCLPFLDFIKKIPNASKTDQIQRDLKLLEKAQEHNQAEEDYETNRIMENEDYSISFVSSSELKQRKMEIMLEALFLKFFSPIDEGILLKDMEITAIVAGTNSHTEETEECFERLSNPHKNSHYYRKLSQAEISKNQVKHKTNK